MCEWDIRRTGRSEMIAPGLWPDCGSGLFMAVFITGGLPTCGFLCRELYSVGDDSPTDVSKEVSKE